MESFIAGSAWQSCTWLGLACLVSLTGSLLALRDRTGGLLRSGGETKGALAGHAAGGLPSGAAPLWQSAVLFALTGLAVVLICFEAFYPTLGLHFPLPPLLEGWALQGMAGSMATLIAVRRSRNIRNVALAGALLSGGTSCMLFIGMSGLAAPAPLAYDLRGILLAMGGSGTLAAIGVWHAGGYWQGDVARGWKPYAAAACCIAASLVIVVSGSLASILSFSDWSNEIDMPGGFAFQPIVVVFISETAVTALLAVVGEAIDRRAASLINRETERLRELTESTFEALVIHRGGIVLDANQVFCNLVGKRLSAIKGEPFATLLSGGGGLSGGPGGVEAGTADAAATADALRPGLGISRIQL